MTIFKILCTGPDGVILSGFYCTLDIEIIQFPRDSSPKLASRPFYFFPAFATNVTFKVDIEIIQFPIDSSPKPASNSLDSFPVFATNVTMDI